MPLTLALNNLILDSTSRHHKKETLYEWHWTGFRVLQFLVCFLKLSHSLINIKNIHILSQFVQILQSQIPSQFVF